MVKLKLILKLVFNFDFDCFQLDFDKQILTNGYSI